MSISVQSFSVHTKYRYSPLRYIKCQFRYKHLRYKTTLIMVALWNRADHYIFMLWFVLLLLLLLFFISSPNLSRHRFDVCRTSTHGVALVRISDAGLKPTARGSLKTQDAEKLPKIAIWAPSHNFVGLYLRN